MTKNNSNADKRTVTVLSENGEAAGFTYPKRAAGLVKKGRARYVNDSTILLENSVSDVTNFTEDIKMDNNIINNTLNEDKKPQPEQPVNRLFFNAREWSFNKDCKNNVGSRSFMQGPDGIINEAFTIGDWGWNWTEIVTKSLILPKHTLHTFTFWLNGGENDNNNEICRLEITFNNDWENRYTYNLNRNFIKPLKKCRGWELYEIPFITADNEYTQLKFVAQRAYMTVMNAKAASEYADLPEIPDEFEGERPQRHNIVFDDGFPTNTWYSTRKLRAEREKREASQKWEEKTTGIPMPKIVSIPSETKSVLIDLILSAGLPVDIVNTLINNLIGTGGSYSGAMIDDILAKGNLSEETTERLNRLKSKIADKIAEIPPVPPVPPIPPTSPSSGIEAVSGIIDGLTSSITGTVFGIIDGMHEEIIHKVQQAVEEAINGVDSGDVDIDADDIADTIMDHFESRISDMTDAITDKLDEISDTVEDVVDELNDRLDELNEQDDD